MALIPRRWRASRAVAAIIVVSRRGYLLQLRDDRKGIWYPGYWGLFGGTAEPDETAEAAMRRELAEELSLVDVPMRRFMTTILDFAPPDARIERELFEVRLPQAALAGLRLGEGRAMRCWPARAVSGLQLVPADRFVLDFHAARASRGRTRAGG